ncbi:MAG: transcription-repair coupling factor [Alphaproteobacteria bacterium]|nr:transcription-repair coupling factor [Alphaproteobacteria bacterium]
MAYDIEKYKGKTLASVPVGYNAFLLADMISCSKSDILFVAGDGKELEDLADALKFLTPQTEILVLPAWDTVPYDRVSPNINIISKRIETLTALALNPNAEKPRLLLTSVGGAIQKLPPKKIFLNTNRVLSVGGKFDFNAFVHYAFINGYSKVEQVMEPAEYAVRGDIIDIFPASNDVPLRLDLFDDTIERIRTFDVMSQRTTGEVDSYRFGVGSEVILDDNSIKNFRSAYLENFGAAGLKDELYESISNGVKYIGYEHWLPLFYDEPLPDIFDYAPMANVVLSQNVEAALEAKVESIYDYYMARLEALKVDDQSSDLVYRPIAPEMMYLQKEEFNTMMADKKAVLLTDLSLPGKEDAVNLPIVPGRDFSHAKNISVAQVFEDLKDYLVMNGRLKRVIAVSTPGTEEKLMGLADNYGLENIVAAASYQDALMLSGMKKVAVVVLNIARGFKSDELCVISETDIFGARQNRRTRKVKAEDFIADVSSLNVGDLVVHVEHGLGRFMGLENIVASGAPHDCLKILYAHDDKLFVPVENIEVISRYGADDDNITFDTLGGSAWEIKKNKVKEKIKEIATGLIKVAAERQIKSADVFMPPAGLYDDFCARFEYHETDDQKKAIDEVLADLNTGVPMDRLVCGDVGFGKTEVALRAAFVVASNGAQVALIVPTTLLARQHYINFKTRFEGFGIKVKMLSRLTSNKESKEIVGGLKDGNIEIVIGTHALLSENIKFCNLGLLIVDEEQHFGVTHKEKIKNLKTDVHVLTLSATPIPRTLQLSLTGVKQLSLIATPPLDRLAARTFVMPFDKVIIKEAILREKYRGGQTFFVCPRVSDIAGLEKELSALLPEVKIAVAHGQMRAKDLEDIMTDFAAQKYDILLSTTIIESGIDMPSVNTMIVYRADMFGLAQLYQLKGRIGRSKVRGYCYLTTPGKKKIKPASMKRLEILSALDTLGAGFSLASHDMDIRGSGNVLGTEQSGHIKDVGIGLYHHMLQEEIVRQKALMEGQTSVPVDDFSPQILVGIPVMIPESYVKDLGVRLGLYKRIGALTTNEELLDMKAELVDRFGPVPPEIDNLLAMIEIKHLSKQAGIGKIEAGAKGFLIAFHNNVFSNVVGLLDFVNRSFGTVKIRPDQKLFVDINLTDYKKRLEIIKKYVILLANLAQKESQNG